MPVLLGYQCILALILAQQTFTAGSARVQRGLKSASKLGKTSLSSGILTCLTVCNVLAELVICVVYFGQY